jgi:hypothetical protein
MYGAVAANGQALARVNHLGEPTLVRFLDDVGIETESIVTAHGASLYDPDHPDDPDDGPYRPRLTQRAWAPRSILMMPGKTAALASLLVPHASSESPDYVDARITVLMHDARCTAVEVVSGATTYLAVINTSGQTITVGDHAVCGEAALFVKRPSLRIPVAGPVHVKPGDPVQFFITPKTWSMDGQVTAAPGLQSNRTGVKLIVSSTNGTLAGSKVESPV